MIEPRTPEVRAAGTSPVAVLIAYVREVVRSCFGSRNGVLGMLVAVLPAGALGLGLALQSNLSVEMGMDTTSIGWLSLWSSIMGAIGCVLGGVLSDKLGRRLMLTLYIVAMSLPTIWLAYRLREFGWIWPRADDAPKVIAPDDLLRDFWIAAIVYSLFQGLMYGSRSALFMDLCKSEIAATQFTAFMSLMNLAIAYSAWWQGYAAEEWGYPATLAIDAGVGVLCLLPMALLNLRRRDRPPRSKRLEAEMSTANPA
ncbi:MAG: MFS transporter [Pirellulales bacterium]